MKGLEAAKTCADNENLEVQKVLSFLQVVHEIKHQTDAQTCARLLECHNLTKEYVPSPLQKSTEVSAKVYTFIELFNFVEVILISCFPYFMCF